jgi:hypothetical protein
MSLITLKNDDNSKPYSWRNYFREPIEIEPKSSISLVSAVVKTSKDFDMEDSETFYWTMGSTTELNPVYQGRLDLGIDTFTAEQLANDVTDDLLTIGGQALFNNDGFAPNESWSLKLNNDQKFVFSAKQNPVPDELPSQAWTGIPNAYFTSAIGAGANDYTRIRRTGLLAPTTAEQSVGASWSQGICPRNGGHIIFKPTPLGGGGIPRGHKYALGSTNPTAVGSEISYFTSPAGQASGASFGQIGIHLQPGAGGSALAQPYFNDGDLEVGNEINVGASYQTIVGTNPVFCIEWVSPYSMLIKYSLNYDPTNPGTDFLNANWVTMYDMRADPAGVIQIPTYLDNHSPMVQIVSLNEQVEVRGTLTTTIDQSGKWDWVAEGYGRDDPKLRSRMNIPTTDDFVGVYPNVFLKKDVKILGDTKEVGFTDADRVEWENGFSVPLTSTEFSKLLGFTPPIITLVNTDPTYREYQAVGNNKPSVNNKIPTLHIQMTNLAIKSKNGVVSNNVKDVSIIPLFDDDDEDDVLRYIAPYENRINLNNLEKLNLNELDILITGDGNQPADFLTHHTCLVVKVHKGEV